jgi:hypothetical protein
MDNQMRINAQLIDVVSQGHLWSQEYNREVTGGLGIQSDVASRVAQQLTAQLTVGRKQPIEDQRTGSLNAHTLHQITSARPLDLE